MARYSGARCIHNVALSVSRPAWSSAWATQPIRQPTTNIHDRKMNSPRADTGLEYSRNGVRPQLLAGVGQRVGLPLGVEQVDRLDLEIAQRVGGVAGPREQEALGEVAAHVAQDLELLPGLDAFGDHLDVQAARHGNDGAHD